MGNRDPAAQSAWLKEAIALDAELNARYDGAFEVTPFEVYIDGAFSPADLRVIADKVEQLNEKHKEYIDGTASLDRT